MNADRHREDNHDRLADQALQELLGGHTPPDLSQRILQRAAQPANESVRPASPSASRQANGRRWALVIGAVAAALACGLLLVATIVSQTELAHNMWNRSDHAAESRRDASIQPLRESANRKSHVQEARRGSTEGLRPNAGSPGRSSGERFSGATGDLDRVRQAAPGGATPTPPSASFVKPPGQTLGRSLSRTDHEVPAPSVPAATERASEITLAAPATGDPAGPTAEAGGRSSGAGRSGAGYPVPANGAGGYGAAGGSFELATSPLSDSYGGQPSDGPAHYGYGGYSGGLAGPAGKAPVLSDESLAAGGLAWEPANTPAGVVSEGLSLGLADAGYGNPAPPGATSPDGLQFESRASLPNLKKWNREPSRRYVAPESGDRYEKVAEQSFIEPVGDQALSTVSVDVDTASYSNLRRFVLAQGQLPPPAAVRIEEMVNYFSYQYEPPTGEHPFAVHLEAATCPWEPRHRLVRVALKGREVSVDSRPPANLVFLVDVSGSMSSSDKLPLVVEGLKELTRNLRGDDRVAVVVYASQEGLALPSTSGENRQQILQALDRLSSGGSTAGGAGIQLAYQVAGEHFQSEGINRVILCTDGDFNVGVTDTEALKDLVAEQASTGTYLTVLGFGRGNLNDQMMEAITNRGNGNYYYIDNLTEARRVLVGQMSGTLVTIAKDVKLQIEFNPARVARYRLVGYDNRVMPNQDFADDRKDAGEIGAGHTVTFFYEVQPVGAGASAEPLRYQSRAPAAAAVEPDGPDAELADELLAVKLRYKMPESQTSTLMMVPLVDQGKQFEQTDGDFQFAASVVACGLLLKNSPYRGQANWAQVQEWAESSRGQDPDGQRTEFLEIIRRASQMMGG